VCARYASNEEANSISGSGNSIGQDKFDAAKIQQ
jgi:hypothetical protein